LHVPSQKRGGKERTEGRKKKLKLKSKLGKMQKLKMKKLESFCIITVIS
jgi:hypothetical protein